MIADDDAGNTILSTSVARHRSAPLQELDRAAPDHGEPGTLLPLLGDNFMRRRTTGPPSAQEPQPSPPHRARRAGPWSRRRSPEPVGEWGGARRAPTGTISGHIEDGLVPHGDARALAARDDAQRDASRACRAWDERAPEPLGGRVDDGGRITASPCTTSVAPNPETSSSFARSSMRATSVGDRADLAGRSPKALMSASLMSRTTPFRRTRAPGRGDLRGACGVGACGVARW
jgi:hypothetical protein